MAKIKSLAKSFMQRGPCLSNLGRLFIRRAGVVWNNTSIRYFKRRRKELQTQIV